MSENNKGNSLGKKAKMMHLVLFELKLLLKYSQAAVILPFLVLFSLLMMRMGEGSEFFTVIVIMMTYMLGVIFNRQFSIAENEFLLFQLLPVPFAEVLIAKNASSFLFAAVMITAVVIVTGVVYHFTREFVISSLLLAFFLAVLFLSIGNILSLRALKKRSAFLSLFDNMIMMAVLFTGVLVHAVMIKLSTIYLAVSVYVVVGAAFYMFIFFKTRKMFYRDRKRILESL